MLDIKGHASTYSNPLALRELIAAGKDTAAFGLNGGAAKLGALIRQYVVKSGYSSVEAATEAAGLPRSALTRFSAGTAAGISVLALRRLSKLFDMSPDELADTILHCDGAATVPATDHEAILDAASKLLGVPELKPEVPELEPEAPEPEPAEEQFTAEQLMTQVAADMQTAGLPAVAVAPSVTVTMGDAQMIIEQLDKEAAPVIIETQGRRVVVQVAQ